MATPTRRRKNKALYGIGIIAITILLAVFLLSRLFSSGGRSNLPESETDLDAIHLDYLPPRQLSNDSEPFIRKELIRHLKRYHLTPPAALDVPYNLSKSDSSYHEHDLYHQELLKILKEHHKIGNGFFVEAGALDGQFLSHSLELEMEHGWSGLLVEASPSLTGQLRSKKRKCWSADVCLTGAPYKKIEYITKKDQSASWKRGNGKVNPIKSGISLRNFEGEEQYRSEGEVECFSLYSLLVALDVKVVDLLVLDIEGHEFQVLSTYPYDKIPIKVIGVEHNLLPIPYSSELMEFMFGKGYKLVHESQSDYVFVLKGSELRKREPINFRVLQL